MTNDDDLQLLKKIAGKDPEAFSTLMARYQGLVYGYSIKMLKDRVRAEDLVQEAWIKVVVNAGSFKPVGSVRSWILSILRNLIIDEFRANKKWVELSEEDWGAIEDPQSGIENLFSEQQKSEQLQKAFMELPENQKLVLSMILVEELSQAEVAAKIGTSVGAVKALLFRARENLKKNIEGIKNV
ncbi:MAG: polymerase family sigma subunit [Pseudobdellovibrio sp.]|jgi:RNA polymerase sigma-70 factor (ECF subfamily)|nr:polymerase family sigma subunit [Pseudobdellovibrio sp.]